MLDLEQLLRGFLWCQGDLQKGRAKVAWESVCLPKWEWGLDFRRLEAFSQALITSHVRPLVQKFIWHRLGDGSTVSTWFDNWCSISPLSRIILNRDIYEAGIPVSSKVSDIILNGSWTWPNNWSSKFPSLSSIVIPHLSAYVVDGLYWNNGSNIESDFLVSIAWDSIRPRGPNIDWYHLVWFSHQIPRHAIRLWLVIKRKLKTQDTLKQWDVDSNTDSHDHLFFECNFSL
ncbi:GRF1-interacting factor 1-like protein [Tanacetum coccineum]